MTVLKWIALAAMVGYLGGTAVLFFQQRSFIFPVPTTSRTAPAAAGLPGAEEQVLTTTDGEQVIVWHVPPRPGHAVVLFFHGNGDFLAGLVGRFREITRDGTGLVALSYRGYAGSTGRPSEQGLLLDADAAYGFALARYGAERIVAWGFSLGSGVAVALAANHPVSKLVLEAPFTSITDVAAAKLPFIPVGWLLRDQFRSDRRIATVQAPLLIMHGERDSIIPFMLGERLFALAREPKQFVRFPEGGHDDLAGQGAIETALIFIAGTNG
jgi:fermentation-respiration switch protein FrsA (DUF1100 family)